MTAETLYTDLVKARALMRSKLAINDYMAAINACQHSIRIGVAQCGWNETESAFNAIKVAKVLDPKSEHIELLFMAALIEIFEPTK